ncbi:MAG: ACT domain-containing protein [Prolixibacteraceae bacterium]|nr:ACT domain-containing protein [Prolixibacteraceae bacterium]
MIIQQLSVFLENKTGRLSEVASLLGEAGINMSAFSVADTSDFGILRVIVSQPENALKLLKEQNFTVSLTEVVALICPNESGALARALAILKDENVEIEYLYAFSMDSAATIIIRPANTSYCIEVLKKHELELVRASDLYRL